MIARIRLTLLLCVAVFFFSNSRACTCLQYPNDFFAGINYLFNHSPTDSVHIVKAVWLDTVSGYGRKFRVLRYYSGDTNKDTIIVWGYAGQSCRVNILASPGDTLIMAMRILRWKEGIQESLDDFSVSSCGRFILHQTRDSVFGGGVGTFAFGGYSFGQFEDSLCKVLGGLCPPPLSLRAPTAAKDFKASVFPNPSAGKFQLLTQNGSGSIRLSITAMDGVVLYSRTYSTAGGRHLQDIDLEGWTPGRYIVRLVGSAGSTALPLVIGP